MPLCPAPLQAEFNSNCLFMNPQQPWFPVRWRSSNGTESEDTAAPSSDWKEEPTWNTETESSWPTDQSSGWGAPDDNWAEKTDSTAVQQPSTSSPPEEAWPSVTEQVRYMGGTVLQPLRPTADTKADSVNEHAAQITHYRTVIHQEPISATPPDPPSEPSDPSPSSWPSEEPVSNGQFEAAAAAAHKRPAYTQAFSSILGNADFATSTSSSFSFPFSQPPSSKETLILHFFLL